MLFPETPLSFSQQGLHPVKVCVVSIKECWQGPDNRWFADGGFPLQMAGIASLFDAISLVVIQSKPKEGGLPLPPHARVVTMRKPVGSDTRRKLSVIANMPSYLGEILRQCREADVVHIPIPGDFPFLGMLTALLLRKRLIVRYCGSWHPTAQTTLMNRVTRTIMRTFAGGRNVMLATGGGTNPPAPRVSWIFASALTQRELDEFRPDLDRSLSSPPRLIYAGRLSPEKGVANLIAAVSQLKKEGFGRLPLVSLAGDGPERQRLETLVRQQECSAHFRFMGQLNRADLSREFLQADFCVQPSLTEGFSKAWLDAMAHGLPVLASEVGAAPDVIGRNRERGWIVPPGDVTALARALQHILCGDTDWPQLRRRCRSFVQERTLEEWARQIGEICSKQWGVPLVEGKLRPLRGN